MATWILTQAAASLVVSKLPKTKHSNPFNMSVFVASIYVIPTQKQTKTSPNYVLSLYLQMDLPLQAAHMVPLMTGINLGYIGTLPSTLFPLWAICWLKTPFLQASNLPPRPLPPANDSSHPNWLKHHWWRCVASPQPSEDFGWGQKKKNMPKNISNCLNPMYFWVDPCFCWRMVDQDPKTISNHVFHWLRSLPIIFPHQSLDLS